MKQIDYDIHNHNVDNLNFSKISDYRFVIYFTKPDNYHELSEYQQSSPYTYLPEWFINCNYEEFERIILREHHLSP